MFTYVCLSYIHGVMQGDLYGKSGDDVKRHLEKSFSPLSNSNAWNMDEKDEEVRRSTKEGMLTEALQEGNISVSESPQGGDLNQNF
jgi:hypothetical protein